VGGFGHLGPRPSPSCAHIFRGSDLSSGPLPRRAIGARRLWLNRRHRWLILALAFAVFIVISGLLARFLSVENTERDDELALLQREAAGDASGLIAQISGCGHAPACVATQRANARSLRRPGDVTIISLQSGTAYTLTGATGLTRLAWRVPGRLPVVQCVTVRRSGNFLTGLNVTVLGLSSPIGNTADC
jgi:hypothetical protein